MTGQLTLFVFDLLHGDWVTPEQYLWRHRIGVKNR